MTTPTPKPRPAAGRFQDLDPDKLRGGYYTSGDLTEWIAQWALRSSGDRVLEPSCGDGNFLVAAAERLLSLGASGSRIDKQIVGVEIIAAEADAAAKRLVSTLAIGESTSIDNQDFFSWWSHPDRGEFDVVVGNPPFIRYQTFPEPHRSRAMEIMQSCGLRPNKLTNIWVPFVVAAAEALVPGGRMGLVLPAELLQVSYAAQLRTYLVERFAEIHVVACNELFFDKAEQEVVILLAEGAHQVTATTAPRVSVSQLKTRQAVVSQPAQKLVTDTEPKIVQHGDEKWLKYFLTQREIDLLRRLRATVAAPLSKFATVDVGVVTGKNEFFVVTAAQVREWGLERFVLPLAARAAHIPGARFSRADWTELAKTERVWLLQLGAADRAELPTRALAYVERGEELGHHLGYKCSIRKPWYSVPSVWTPDAFLFRQIHDFPRLVLNDAKATCTDTIHRVRFSHGVDPEQFASMLFTSLTAASAEIEGRSYGGGVLELEPTEAERLLVPQEMIQGLPIAEIDALIRAGKLNQAIEQNDLLVLRQGMGLSASDIKLLKSASSTMRERRQGRRRVRKDLGSERD